MTSQYPVEQEQGRGKKLLQRLKSFFTGRTPYKLCILLKQLGHGVSYFGEIQNKASIVPGKTQKLTDLMH
jgi:hypothetical protein